MCADAHAHKKIFWGGGTGNKTEWSGELFWGGGNWRISELGSINAVFLDAMETKQ